MFHDLTGLIGVPVITTDGEKRLVRNFLFDDRTWSIGYLVVDAGTWLAPRQVVVPISALEPPDWRRRLIAARITLTDLLGSPEAETIRPVSRQQQLAWNRHFGWPEGDPYWCGPPSAPGREFSLQGKDDPHLRRALDLTSYQVWEDDDSLGLLGGFFVEEGSWHIGYLLVRSGEWVYRDRMITTRNVESISWGQHRVLLDSADNGVAARRSQV
jgi:hypothetical protein